MELFYKSGGNDYCCNSSKVVTYQVVEFSKSEAFGRSSALEANALVVVVILLCMRSRAQPDTYSCNSSSMVRLGKNYEGMTPTLFSLNFEIR